MNREILVATDFSPLSRRATDFAALLAREAGARLGLVHVIEPIEDPASADEDSRSFHQALLEKATRNLESESQRLGNENLEKFALIGPRVETLLQMAQRRKPMMMVVGRDDHPGVGLRFEVQASCPVLSVP